MPRCRAPLPLFCLACHGDRLASLLETASMVRLYRLTPQADILEEGSWPMPDGGLPVLATLLSRAGVAVLICGGATCCCLAHFQRVRVAVVPWIAGTIDTVLTAVRENRLETLLVPGARLGRMPGPHGCSGLTRLEKLSS